MNKIYKNIAFCKKIGLNVHVSFIAGFPGSSEEDMRMAINFIKRTGLYVKMPILWPFPGTEARKIAIKHLPDCQVKDELIELNKKDEHKLEAANNEIDRLWSDLEACI